MFDSLFCAIHRWALNDRYRADYWLSGSSVRSTVGPWASREILVSICMMVKPLRKTNSLLAADINTWNVMLLVTASNRLTIDSKVGKMPPLGSWLMSIKSWETTCSLSSKDWSWVSSWQEEKEEGEARNSYLNYGELHAQCYPRTGHGSLFRTRRGRSRPGSQAYSSHWELHVQYHLRNCHGFLEKDYE